MKSKIDPTYTNVPSTLKRYGIRPVKSRGQHFLINDAICQRIVRAADLSADSVVLEIGAGTGALTRFLTTTAAQVVAIEIDRKLVRLLNCEFESIENLTILNQNILDLDITSLAEFHQTKAFTIVSNLPYNITGPVLDMLIAHRRVINKAVIMVQNEVGNRLVATPGTKVYGILSIVMPYYYRIESIFRVAGGNFIPRPDVESAVLQLTPLADPPVKLRDPSQLFTFVREAFQQRRKMLHHAVNRHAPGAVEEISHQTGIDLKRRAETLTLEEFAELANAIYDFNQQD